ncbi:MAG TPA: hypothetical protein VES20_20975 [Bryobacteraceae bacterium]|nr:hypothetical protein [Bryobacteraceae bacterium]
MSETKEHNMEDDRWPADLNELFCAYRTGTAVPEPSRDFMPGMWARIDARQKVTYRFRRLASGFVTAAAALCLLMSVALWSPAQQGSLSAETYVEALADDAADSGLEQ